MQDNVAPTDVDGTFEVPDRRLESPRIRNHYDYDAKRLNSNGEGKPSLFCVMLLSSIKKKFHSASTSFITESTPEYRRPRKLENLTEFDEDAPHATQGFTPNDSTRHSFVPVLTLEKHLNGGSRSSSNLLGLEVFDVSKITESSMRHLIRTTPAFVQP